MTPCSGVFIDNFEQMLHMVWSNWSFHIFDFGLVNSCWVLMHYVTVGSKENNEANYEIDYTHFLL